MQKKLLTLAIAAYSSVLTADTLELSPNVNATPYPGIPIPGPAPKLSDLSGTTDILVELQLSGKTGTYDTTKVFPQYTPEFSLNADPITTSSPTDGYDFLQNLVVEGQTRDGSVLTFSSRALSPSTPYPTPDPYELFLNSIHVKDATLEIKDPNSSGNPAIDNGVSIKSIEHLQLDNAAFKIKTGTGSGSIRFNNANVATLVANSGQNIFEVAGSDFNAVKLDVIIESNAGLTLQNTSSIKAQDGSLQMKQGSSLTLNKSAVILDSPNRSSNLEGATVNLSGTFGTVLANGVGSSHLDLNNPNIKNSTFNLDNNTAFRARGRVLSGTNDGLLNLSGTNVFNLADGAFVTSSGDNNDKYQGSVNVNGGSSSFVSSVAGTRVKQNGLFAKQWDVINGGTLSLERIDGAADVNFISLSSGSTLKLHTLDNLDNLSTLEVSDSAIESSIGDFTSPYIELRNATLKPEKLNSQDHTNITFSGTAPSANSVVLRGTNTVKLDITPQGRDITPSIKVYNDEFNIYDSAVTGAVSGVSGFNTLKYELDTQTTGLRPNDFAVGGASGDGRYTVSNLSGSTIDGDAPSFSLGAAMPALLQASLDSTPSIDKTVVIKLSELPTSALATLSQVVNSHQTQTITTIVTEPNTGNVSTITVTITPDASGTATKTLNTVITAPNGSLISNTTTTSQLAPASGSKNTGNAAKLLANAAQTNTLVASQLQQLTQQQLTDQFPSIHPEPYSSFATVGLEQSDMTLKTVMRHASNLNTFSLGESFSESFTESGTNTLANGVTDELKGTPSHTFWYEATYLTGDVDGNGDLGSYGYDLGAFTLGRTFLSTADYAWGGFLSIGHTHMDEHDLAQQDFKSNNVDIGVYHRSNHGTKLELASVVGFGLSEIKSQRNFSVANADYNANARYDSKTLYAGVNANYALASYDWGDLRPHAGVHGIYSQQGDVQENGAGAYNITIDENENAAIVTSLGMHSFFESISENHEIKPILGLTYEHDWYANDNKEHDINAGISASPDYKLKFDGQNRGANAWIVDAGLRGSISEDGILNGGVSYTKTSHGKEWGAGLRAEWPF